VDPLMAVRDNDLRLMPENIVTKRALRIFGISSRGLVDSSDFQRLAQLFEDSPAGFVPTKMGLYEPYRLNFDPAVVADLAARSEDLFQMTWKSPKSQVEVTKYIPGYMHGTLLVTADPDAVSDEDLESLIEKISVTFEPILLMVHLLNPMDREVDIQSGMRIEGSDLPTFSTHWSDLKNGLPNFYWGMVFGKPYVELFGLSKLLSTPAYRVKQLGGHAVFVQLSSSLKDCELRHDNIIEARKSAIRHLGEAAFVLSTIESMRLSTPKRESLFGKRGESKRVAPLIAP
jgi:hypothetical protein